MQAQIGKIYKTMKEVLSLKPGAVVEFNKLLMNQWMF
jgi:hypothetical protein